jgi:hypothetical protein
MPDPERQTLRAGDMVELAVRARQRVGRSLPLTQAQTKADAWRDPLLVFGLFGKRCD